MDFWNADNVRLAVGGAWLVRPEGDAPAALEGVSTDTRELKAGQVFVALRGLNTDGHRFLTQAVAGGAGMLVVDRADALPAALPRPVPVLAVADTGQALLRLAAAYRRTLDATRVIAVGGSNGKTTSVRLIQSVLGRVLRGTASPKSFNNAVGVPLTILAARRGDQYLVCEVGTNAPGEIVPLTRVVEPDLAVITSIGREHLEGLGSLRGVVQEEASLVLGVRPGGAVILNADAPALLDAVRPLAAAQRAQVLTFGFADHADLRITAVEREPDGQRFCLNGRQWFRLALHGRHNALNASAAVAVARRLGLETDAVEAGLAAAVGAPMRLERRVVGGVTFVNDAYNANPESMLAAFDAFAEMFPPGERGGRRVVVLGDMLELGEHADALHGEVARGLAARRVADAVVLVGPRWAAAAGQVVAGDVTAIPDLAGPGAARAAAALRPGDAVLLKGSRGMALERVIRAWEERAGGGTIIEPRPVAGVGP
jgi:UDP-N-acetylmuramoyl-tripeptide--D-alanyl-D-alanine ligase